MRDTIVTATEGIVYPDAYHHPLEIEVRVNTVHGCDLIEPSNVDVAWDWNFEKCNYDLLISLLSKQSWDRVTQSNNVPEATQNCYQVYIIFLIFVCRKISDPQKR